MHAPNSEDGTCVTSSALNLKGLRENWCLDVNNLGVICFQSAAMRRQDVFAVLLLLQTTVSGQLSSAKRLLDSR